MTRKICLVTPEFPPLRWGGLARTVERVAGHLAGAGCDVHVLHYRPQEGLPPLLDENRRSTISGPLTVHDVLLGREPVAARGPSLWDCPHTLTLLMLFESLEMLQRAERFEAFVSFFLYPTSYVTGLLARREGLPHLACAVGNDVKKYFFSPEKAAVCRSALENADRLVFLAHDLLDLAHSLAPVRERSCVIYNSVTPPARPWPGPRAERGAPFVVGAAGIFKHAKGLPYLFKAVASLRAAGPLCLDLAGETRPEEVPVREDLLDRCNIRDCVCFAGVVPHERMPDWLCGLDAFALPSVSEGCPNVLMEAMAAGLPCVATRVGAAETLVEHEVSGLLVPWGDSAALAEALDRIRRDPELAARLGREAARRMESFSPAREREAWTAALDALFATQPGVRPVPPGIAPGSTRLP